MPSFNYPFQLGTASVTLPSDGDEVIIEVQENDYIVVGTDGLFDNLFDNDILEILNNRQNLETEEENIAETIAKAAQLRSLSLFVTPFRQSAFELGLIDTPHGGKLDDITVIVSRVTGKISEQY